ncbi:hypothetical protein BOO35_12620 [Vibrio navarrensis]|nr:hypothetical protein [Vibrio navarrensis]
MDMWLFVLLAKIKMVPTTTFMTLAAMDGLKAGNPKLYNILNQNKFDQGRGLSWLNRRAYNFSKTGNGVRMPLDLQEAAIQYGEATAVNTYKW